MSCERCKCDGCVSEHRKENLQKYGRMFYDAIQEVIQEENVPEEMALDAMMHATVGALKYKWNCDGDTQRALDRALRFYENGGYLREDDD